MATKKMLEEEKRLNEIIYQNVSAGVKSKGILMKDFEDSVGVGDGYFSRKRQGGIIPFIVVKTAAELLEMDLYALIDEKTANVIAADELDRQIAEQTALLESLKAKRAAYDA